MEEPQNIGAAAGQGPAIPERELLIRELPSLIGISLVQIYAAIERGDLATIPNRRPKRVTLSEALRFKDNPPKPGPKPKSAAGSDSNGSEAPAS